MEGVALMVAIVAALAVSLTAVVVLNLTFRRLELSSFRSDHLSASFAAEAGIQYAFARLDRDKPFRDRVENAPSYPYTVSPTASTGPTSEPEPNLRMGNKDVTVRIYRRGPAGSGQFEIRGSADYGR
ncbi:MAG: hypothetical protein HYZ93_04270 [Candidatus Omnitrophica bacterium]|nr:hypothetical protein [Candidatus Omnitrophota bacterium]